MAGSEEQDPMILVRGIDDLRNIYPECVQRGFQEHGKYLYEVHGDYVADRGYNMELIRAERVRISDTHGYTESSSGSSLWMFRKHRHMIVGSWTDPGPCTYGCISIFWPLLYV